MPTIKNAGDKMKNQVIIRVGEKNNFNQTNQEFQELKKFSGKGLMFTNSNSFNPVSAELPSFITINPYLYFHEIKGDISNIKAVRIKVFTTNIQGYTEELIKCINFCVMNDLQILITFQRYLSIATATKFSGNDFRTDYIRKGGYFRPTDETKKHLEKWVKMIAFDCKGKVFDKIAVCDSSGNGCPDCKNCARLSYGMEDATIKALNLSMSGIKDRNGKQGLCKYNCPDCFAKRVCFGKRPNCDKLITNRKIKGELKG